VSNAAGTFDISGTSSGATITTLNGVANSHVTLGGQTLTISNGSTAYAGIIQGTGGLTVTGGTQTLSGANTYSGATNVNAGTLQAGAANTFAPTSAFTIASGATLSLNNFSETIGSLAGAGTVTNGGIIDRTLTTGGDNTSTAFSGVIQNGGGAGHIDLT
jgi:fibronectin-binding autotransporter adhesin